MFSASTSTTRSAYTDSSAGLLANVDLDIVEAIFERGRYATTFPQIFRPYTEVLKESGISPTSDSTYYNFLLKIGVIKAPTWGDKWDLWKTAHTNGTFQPSFASDDETRSTSHKSFASSQLPEVRRRVPFLASASSDLDEGYTGEEESDVDIRPSPHKELPRNGIPEKTVDDSVSGLTDMTGEDLISFDPPIRTSTPIYAQHYHRSPAYITSETSHSFGQSDDTIISLEKPHSTTPRTQAAIAPRHKPQTLSWIDKIDDFPFEARRALEEKADVFYRYGLLWRCWNMWFKTSEWYRITYKNIIVARNNLLFRQILEIWRSTTQHLLALSIKAKEHHERYLKIFVYRTWLLHLKNRDLTRIEAQWQYEKDRQRTQMSFVEWKAKWEKRRLIRWKKDMETKEIKLAEKRRKASLQVMFTRWRVEARARVLLDSRNLNLLSCMFRNWNTLCSQRRHLKSLLISSELQMKKKLFDIWKKRAVLVPLSKDVMVMVNRRQMQKIWDVWCLKAHHNREASSLRRRKMLLSIMNRWKVEHRRKLSMDRKAAAFDKVRLLQNSLKIWRVTSREILFKQIKEKRLLSISWREWKSGMKRVERLKILAEQLSQTRRMRILQSMLTRWRSYLSSIHTLFVQSSLVYRHNLLARCFTKWRSSCHTVMANKSRAERAHDFFSLRITFRVWRGERAKRRAERWAVEKDRKRMWNAFRKWRVLTSKYTDLVKREIVFHKYYDKQTKQRVLTQWTNRVIEVKDRELRVVRQRDNKLMRYALKNWQSRINDIKALRKKSDDLYEIYENENMRRVFSFWRSRTRRAKRLRIAIERSLVERENRLLRYVWNKWYEKRREKELEAIEREVEFLHENVILFAVMDKWKASTEMLPGITADGIRLKSHVWTTWRMALAQRKKAKRLKKERDSKILAEIFGLWRDAANHKCLANARRVRGRARPSAANQFINPNRSPPYILSRANRPHKHSKSSVVDSLNGSTTLGPTPSDHHETAESVHSEPVYSRLREELGSKRRGGSEEPHTQPQTDERREWQNEKKLVDVNAGIERPSSGSEILRALRGVMPGR
ncbi:uncharacterized protein L203_100109 [Cryptococcus depauperatus CBS 7841]|uniref:Sfi1 spindle body domain-containing protein n=1 Tax=Cryptococcus depauperatus CBS 7841 TaxID=1295531 RepID=A0AAJ8JMG3_9TREE